MPAPQDSDVNLSFLKTFYDNVFKFILSALQDNNFILGVLRPFVINFLTKDSGEFYETQGNLDTNNVPHYLIALVILNVTVKGFGSNILLQKNQYPIMKMAAAFCMFAFDGAMQWLFHNKQFISLFPNYSDDLNKKALIFLMSGNFIYVLAGLYRHYQHTKEVKENPDLAMIPSTTISRINQFQLPLKFVIGLICFFYGIQTFEKQGPSVQLPMSALFYGMGMALTQGLFNLIKREKNVDLVMYGLGCGMAEGLALFGCFMLPKEMSVIIRTTIVPTATSLAILFAGFLLYHLMHCKKTENADEITPFRIEATDYDPNDSPPILTV